MEETGLGKKVFFLYPPSVIKDELIKLIIHYEFEVYLLNDHKRASKLFPKYPDSILFINIDKELKESEWEVFIRNMMADPETQSIRIGIVSYEKNAELERKYLLDIMIPCGFINLKLGLKESATILLKTLEVNEVKGRRKYVRIQCDDNNQATLNVKIKDRIYNGKIIDISSVGMACTFDNMPIKLEPKEVLKSIQLRLKGILCTVSGLVYGTRTEENNVIYVIVFDKVVDLSAKSKIQEYISNSLQNKIDRELNKIK